MASGSAAKGYQKGREIIEKYFMQIMAAASAQLLLQWQPVCIRAFVLRFYIILTAEPSDGGTCYCRAPGVFSSSSILSR